MVWEGRSVGLGGSVVVWEGRSWSERVGRGRSVGLEAFYRLVRSFNLSGVRGRAVGLGEFYRVLVLFGFRGLFSDKK